MTDPDVNLVVARLFEEIAQSLEISGDQGHRLRAYRRAARSLAATSEHLDALAAEGRLRELPGIGASMAALISEFLSTGSMRTHQHLVTDYPPGLAPLLRARGFGPAGVQSLHASLGVTTLDEIERAGQDGRLANAIGPRRATELLRQMPALRNPTTALRLKSAWESATALLDLLRGYGEIQLVGAARRMCDMVMGGLDFVGLASHAGNALLDRLERLPSVVSVPRRTPSSITVRLHDGVEVRLFLAERDALGAALVWHTGSEAHLARLAALAEARGLQLTPEGLAMADRRLPTPTEAHVYAALGLPYVVPELREDEGEIEAALAGSLPRLIEQSDLQGDMHCHTNATDGVATLQDMARAARARGYAYMALTDHSRALTITNGLSLERLEDARRQVHQLNQQLAPFTILLGTEMDILEDGSLDYPDATLVSLDYVSAS
ncbi:MAG: PHP domain-containing protein, partial [Chloroflexi bacterium]|nr:PHP domain-containing protein [Chloroflexota bacterium]